MDNIETIRRDAKLIEDLGGPAKLAALLGYDKAGGPQRVQNWVSRGIPARVKLQFPDVFLRGAPTAAKSAARITAA
jgi:hypothetical protein